MDCRTFAEETISALREGLFVFEDREMKRDPVIKTVACIEADQRAVRELLRQSLDCCAVLPSGKLEVLEKDRLAGLHKQADELRGRAAHNDEVLDRFDAAYQAALKDNPSLEPSIFSFRVWRDTLRARIERSKGIIRTTSGVWLASAEGSAYTAETIKNHPRVADEIRKNEPIIAAAEKELPIAEAHLAKAQAILGEAILPGKVDVISAPNEYNQAISRATAL